MNLENIAVTDSYVVGNARPNNIHNNNNNNVKANAIEMVEQKKYYKSSAGGTNDVYEQSQSFDEGYKGQNDHVNKTSIG